MSSLLGKRILFINPTEQGEFPKVLLNKLKDKGGTVYAWVWSIEAMLSLSNFNQEDFTLIMVDIEGKDNSKNFLRVLPPMDFIVKFSKKSKPLKPEFLQYYGSLLKHYPQQTAKDISGRNVSKIMKEMEKVNSGGVIFNIGPETLGSIVGGPIKNIFKSSSGNDTVDTSDTVPLLPSTSSNPRLGSTINIERQNGGLGIMINCFGCCFGSVDSQDTVGHVDLRLRQRLNAVHRDIQRKWNTRLSPADKKKLYDESVQRQYDIFSEFCDSLDS